MYSHPNLTARSYHVIPCYTHVLGLLSHLLSLLAFPSSVLIAQSCPTPYESGFSRQEYLCGLPFHSLGILPTRAFSMFNFCHLIYDVSWLGLLGFILFGIPRASCTWICFFLQTLDAFSHNSIRYILMPFSLSSSGTLMGCFQP